MRGKITSTITVLAAAGGMAVMLPAHAWAASGSAASALQSASGTLQETSATVDSENVVDGNTILVVTISGITTGTFDGQFTETDTIVIQPNGNETTAGSGTQSGTLGTCGTGSASYLTASKGNTSTRSGVFFSSGQSIIRTFDTVTVNEVTGTGTYTGTYQCT
jgi:hypothetical protein